MNRETILKHTTSFKDDLISDLKDSEFAQHYLQAALEDYEQDGDMQSLLLAMGDVAEAQGGIDQLAKRTNVSHQHLYNILVFKRNVRLDNLLGILAGLGFRVQLARCEVTEKSSVVASVS